ncbi:hypothetical protein DRQ36_07570 [bacterium]|nr:MAG: hypothetical protein DRQ36_07570 [bacterium]
MRIKNVIAILFAFAGFGLAEYDVVGLSLTREKDNTVVEVLTSGPTDIKTAKLTKPDRLLIDLIGGVHRLKTDGLPALPPGIVVDIRSAQNQAKPAPITRIVLVLAEPVGEVSVENGPRSGKVFIPTPGYPEFTTWSIGRETPAKQTKPEPVVAPKPEPPVADTGAAKPPSVTPKDTTLVDTTLTIIHSDDTTRPGASFIRPLVKYGGRQYHDPFIVAKPTIEQKFGEEAIPVVEGLKLVGIVKGQNGDPLAVLQDRNGWGYIMGVADSVADGVVGAITDSTVRFDITEFGITRPVTLELPKEATKR